MSIFFIFPISVFLLIIQTESNNIFIAENIPGKMMEDNKYSFVDMNKNILSILDNANLLELSKDFVVDQQDINFKKVKHHKEKKHYTDKTNKTEIVINEGNITIMNNETHLNNLALFQNFKKKDKLKKKDKINEKTHEKKKEPKKVDNKKNATIPLNEENKEIIIKKKCLNNSNFTICFNITNLNKEFCTPECYVNCQVHFTEKTEQKYCLLNVCKCEVETEIDNNNGTLSKNCTEVPNKMKGSLSKNNPKNQLYEYEKLNQAIKSDQFVQFLNADQHNIINNKLETSFLNNKFDIANSTQSTNSTYKETLKINDINSNYLNHAEYLTENSNFNFYCEVLIYSIVCVLLVVIYFSFTFSMISKKNVKFCDFDQRFKNIEIENQKFDRNLVKDEEYFKKEENSRKNVEVIDNDLEEKLLPN